MGELKFLQIIEVNFVPYCIFSKVLFLLLCPITSISEPIKGGAILACVRQPQVDSSWCVHFEVERW